MLKLTKILTATGLGLAMGLSLLTSGAFAQSVNPNATQSTIHAARVQGIYSTDGNWQNTSHHNSHGWNNHGWNNHGWNDHGQNNHGWNDHGQNNHGWNDHR